MNTPKPVAWPLKARELHNHHMDSTVWNDFAFRDGDVIVATWAKSGTTWMQQIVSQLIFKGADNVNVPVISPWLDLRVMPKEAIEAVKQQTHRRVLKTHLPADAMVISPMAKYIYVARDGRDACWSAFNHFSKLKSDFFDMLNDAPGRVGPKIFPPGPCVHQYYREWFAKDGYPLWSFWENIRTWWAVRHLPNVLLVHFNDLKSNLPGMIREVADFLEIEVDDEVFSRVVTHCGFDYMKQNAHLDAPLGGAPWEGGGQTFINKGTNGRWQGTLSPAEVRAYEARAVAELGADCAAWLEAGRFSRAAA